MFVIYTSVPADYYLILMTTRGNVFFPPLKSINADSWEMQFSALHLFLRLVFHLTKVPNS